MLLQMEMDHGVVVRFVICVCLVGISTCAAKCVPEKCGSMNVSYPFWIDHPQCGYPGFKIKCRKNPYTGIRGPFFTVYQGNSTDEWLQGYHYNLMEIDYTGSLIINSSSIIRASSCSATSSESVFFQPRHDGPFTISMSNKFVAIGCGTFAAFKFSGWGEARCESTCDAQLDPPYCRYGCCEITVPDNWKKFNFTGGGVFRLLNSTTNQFDDTLTCGFSTILDPSTFKIVDNKTNPFWGDGLKASYGLRLNWGIGLQNCSMAKATARNYSCSSKAECIDSPSGVGHVCKCLPGYDGNGYFNGTDCTGSVSSFVGVSLVATGLFWWLSVRRLKHARAKNFRQNGGMHLQERIASMGGRKSLRIFSERELEIASDNFSTELGRGGFATVYKGVLVDGMHVAIKKPKSISDEFINEIIILSHISHRNVVKLLGCCMESQFPLLLYEFVPNGRVFQHLHSRDKELKWEARRQIAIETAEAIAYVHLQASQPIFHRDIKSSNILLDNTFTPKVADFGISRLCPTEDRHLSTVIPSGTPGYVDPEFVRSNQFTDKSDVFSFGVVLVELLTGLMPLLSKEGSTCTLYDHFLSTMNENRLVEILDPKVMRDEIQGQMENMAKLAKACLLVKAKARPSMREVVEELVWVRAATKQRGLYRDVSLVEHRGDPLKQSGQNYQSVPTTKVRTEDYYYSSPSITANSSEGPSTALIQIEMSDTYGR